MVQELKELQKAYGEHKEFLEACGLPFLTEISPSAMKAWYEESTARRQSGIFDDRIRELIWLAGCIVARSKPSITVHMYRALKAGATKEEIVETMLLSSLVGSHAMLIDALGPIEETLEKLNMK